MSGLRKEIFLSLQISAGFLRRSQSEEKNDGIQNEDYVFNVSRLVHQDRIDDGRFRHTFVRRLDTILIADRNIGSGFAPFTDEERRMINNRLFKKN